MQLKQAPLKYLWMNDEEVLQHQGLSGRNEWLKEALGNMWWREETKWGNLPKVKLRFNRMKQWYRNDILMRIWNEVNYSVPLFYSAHIDLVSEIQVFVHELWSLLPPCLDGMTGSETNVEDLASPFFPLAPSKTWVDEASISKTCSLPYLVPRARW